jgi:hypothetical protein
MLRPVFKQYAPSNGLDPPPGIPLRQTLMLKCGHFARRKPKDNGLWVQVHCEMCTMLAKERETKDDRRAAKKERRRVRKLRQQMKVERLLMAKKKMAPAKVAKKKDLKKKGKVKKEKGTRVKAGRKLMLVAEHVYAPKGSLLLKTLKAFIAADEHILGENELVVAMEKAGVKAEGKKTVKKLVKGILRNMLRAGVVVKQRDIKKDAELKAFLGDSDEKEEEESDDDEAESDDEDGDATDEDADESEDTDEDGDDEAESDEEDGDGDGDDEEEKPKKDNKKKKVIKKGKAKK